jgi:ATP-dependent protease HslVU (ClpYQ) peptidase subunit
MTCVVGLVEGGRVYMGADSALCDGYEVRAMAGTKMARVGEMLIGHTGTTRLLQLVQYMVKPVAQPEGMSDEEWLVSVFIADVRRVVKENGYTKVENAVESMDGGLLIAYRKHLYLVGASYQLCETKDGFEAIGCGREYAIGAMLALVDRWPRERLLRSLECAAVVCANVCAPFVVEEL